MTLVETGPIEKVTLPNVEEIIAAYVAVREVKGENHPLVSPDCQDSLYYAMDASREPEFSGRAAVEIVESLEKVAEEEDSPIQSTAQWMLEHKNGDSTQTDERESALAPVSNIDEKPATKPLISNSPPFVGSSSELVDGRIELSDFSELVTALRSVENFAGRRRERVVQVLETTIGRIDPFNSKPKAYFGDVGKLIYYCLEKAAERGETTYDANARHMLTTASQPTDFHETADYSPMTLAG